MANTDIQLIDSNGTLVPSADSVSVVSGDTVSFSTSDGTSAFVFFSPDAISVLSPKPASPFPIAPGKNAEFSFSSSQPGAYSAFFAPNASSTPARFPSGKSQVLRLEILASVELPFTGPNDTVGTGH